MPEIKNTFVQGKMNKDLDERLVPSGQYRDALNVEISSSEGSDIGAVKNILGNKRIEDVIPTGFKCVGSVSDEKTNKLYWFVSSYEKDAIIEHDIINDKISPVLVDLNAPNSKAVLRFSGNIITGINIINNLLFWTDNNSEPKKINIDECKRGTVDFNTHTQLIFENGSFNAITLKHVGSNSSSSWNEQGSDSKTGRYFWFEQKQIEKLFPKEFNGTPFSYGADKFHVPGPAADLPYYIRHYRNGQYLGRKRIKIWGNFIDNGVYVGASNNGSHARLEPYTDSGPVDWHEGDIIFGDNMDMDIEERHVTVIKPKPLKALTVKINHVESLESANSTPNLFETTFPRFSYRYKYRDGEYSAFAPFTETVFNAKYTKDLNNTNGASVFHTKDNIYDEKDPHNKAMVNSIHSVELTDFVTSQTPEDAVEIELLYKQENSNVIYSIDTIKQTSEQWHESSSHEGFEIGLGRSLYTGAGTANPLAFQAIGSHNKGKYVVTTENIHSALPANQLLRPWDNVPRKALGQEMTGNRIVYGNYLQNYNLGNVKPEIKVSYSSRDNRLATFENKGLPSVKSQRNYQLGVVYCDKYGRETPVFTSNEAAVNIPWSNNEMQGIKNASQSLQLNASIPTNFPQWVDSLKFFVKETSSPYYNLIMDRAWVAKSTYEIDRGEHLWISFPSSDRNKISEEDYIILKKKIGTGEDQISFENKFKVIDISNEAPDAIKYELVNYGTATNNSDYLTDIASGLAMKQTSDINIDKEGAEDIAFNFNNWKVGLQSSGIPLEAESPTEVEAEDAIVTKDLYVSWRRLGSASGAGASSKKYKITAGKKGGDRYTLKLSTPITKIDADIAHVSGDSSDQTTTTLHPDLIFQVERRTLKDSEDFSGKFFVKISKNQVTNIVEEGYTSNILDNYIVSAKAKSWYWQDDIGTQISTDSSNYGITNYNGYPQTYSAQNNIQTSTQNSVGNNHPYFTENLKLTDYSAAWDGIKTNFGNTFFIDSMHMVAGQSETSNYAKYCCVTWAGCTEGQGESKEISSWSYPPLKMWLTDWINSENVIETPEGGGVGGPSYSSGGLVAAAQGLLPNQDRFWEAIDSGLIETSPANVADDDFKLLTTDADGVKVTGWVGVSQVVDRHTPGSGYIVNNHVNALEGIVTTVEDHSIGARRWVSGMSSIKNDYSAGVDTKVYSDNGETNRHFIHLSFFAPGKDLHDGSWYGTSNMDYSTSFMFGPGAFMANLQGIWGGGLFTGGNSNYPAGHLLNQDRFGTGSEKFASLPMEGNYDPNTSGWLPETPGPGVGFGYDTSKNYRELHERQWDPTFCDDGDSDHRIRDFIRNLHAGAQFKFSNDPSADPDIYTIKKVVIKKLYNHTSWRTPINRWADSTDGYYSDIEDYYYQSVEEAALKWLDTVPDGGGNSNGTDSLSGLDSSSPNGGGLAQKIVDFGKAHNRRLCYIIEVDKNPVDQSFNPLQIGGGTGMTADLTDGEFANIEFLEKVQSTELAGLNKFPALWEVDPKKQQVDLDIYYEASGNIPVRLNEHTNEFLAPVGCKVEVIGGEYANTSHLLFWDGNKANFEPGFAVGNDYNEIDYSGMLFKFTKEDGSFIILTADEQQLEGLSTSSADYKTDFVFRNDIGDTLRMGLAWYNCFSFGNGLESNRIRDDFNEMYIGNGVKASTITQQTYEEEHRSNGLIYSGLYNSNSGVNDLNQFIMAEKITKDLNPTYGSIQKLFSRNTDLVTFCEDKVVKVLANKDAVFNADGNTNLTATENVLGQTIPFIGEYGISTNPESFASESYRAYFTDKQRGAVIRLSKDGLTPISKAGMHDWFRDNLQNYSSLIGSYDSYKEDYNITLSQKFGENFIVNSYFDEGIEIQAITGSLQNYIDNSGVNNGVSFRYAYEEENVLDTSSAFQWNVTNPGLDSQVIITNHPEILQGEYQNQILADTIVDVPETFDVFTTVVTTTTGTSAASGTVTTTSTTTSGDASSYAGTGTVGTTTTTITAYDPGQFLQGGYDTNLPNTIGSGNWYYDPYFSGGTNDPLFGPDRSPLADAQVHSEIRRVINGVHTYTLVDPSGNNWGANNPIYDTDPNVSKDIFYPETMWGGGISQCITRSNGNYGSLKSIIFDRPNPDPIKSYVEFKDIGTSTGAGSNQTSVPSNFGKGIMQTYFDASTSAQLALSDPNYGGAVLHKHIYNGDEIHIQFELIIFKTLDGYSWASGGTDRQKYGYNYIIPQLQLFDGNTPVDGNLIKQNIRNSVNASTPGQNIFDGPYGEGAQSNVNDQGSDFYNFNNPTTTSGSVVVVGWNEKYREESSGNSNTHVGSVWSCIKKDFSHSSTVTFPDTKLDSSWEGNWSGSNTFSPSQGNYYTQAGSLTIVCGVSFTFEDPQQQTGNIYGDQDITEKKLINDLRIRISNAKPAYSGTVYEQSGANYFDQPEYENPTNTIYPLKHQLWGIKNLKIKKGYGLTAPHQPPVVTPGVFQTAVTTLVAGQSATYIDPQPYVPAETVPAWTEVQHLGMNGWSLYTAYGNTSDTFVNATSSSNYGSDFGKNTILTPLAPNGVSYYTPENYPTVTTGNPDVSYNQYPTSTAASPTSVDDNYLQVETHPTSGSAGAVDLVYPLTDPWIVDNWYLVDIEYDNSFQEFPISGGSGSVHVYGVADLSGTASAGIHNEGVGFYSGGTSAVHCMLAHSVVRTEYGNSDGTGDDRVILRALFKVDSNSYVANNTALNTTSSANYGTPQDELRLRFYDFTSPVRITKVIVKRLDAAAIGGTAVNWNHKTDILTHSFSSKKMYYKEFQANQPGKLLWDVPTGDHYYWSQNFDSGLLSAPLRTPMGWKLKFTIGDNQDYYGDYLASNNFHGKIKGYLYNKLGDAPDGSSAEGFVFSDIEDKGDYEISFNLEAGSTPTIKRTAPDGTVSDPYIAGSATSIATTTSTNIANKIAFYNQDDDTLRASLSNMSLIDQTLIFQGGSSGSWNWNGFNPSIDSYVVWDEIANRIQFGELDNQDNLIKPCPYVDPASTLDLKIGISASQWINRVINRYETYEITFTHGITQGRLDIYYFNSEGYGFRIKSIGPGSPTSYAAQVMVGADGDGNMSEMHSPAHPTGQTTTTYDQIYQPELRETFVITPSMPNTRNIYANPDGFDYDTNEVVGWIDNITMTRVYGIELNPTTGEPMFDEKTVTFSEDVNGWTSFKSFVPESGVNLSKKYFTFNDGRLYRHYTPLKYNWLLGEWEDSTASEAENYNIFYDEANIDYTNQLIQTLDKSKSRIKFVLNAEPSVVKIFNTLGYEGTQSHVTKPSHQDFITVNNALAWQNNSDIAGWNCEEIKSDLDAGSVTEFIKKEGKWFNYIKGKTLSTETLDTSRFSTQGIGIVTSLNSL